MSVDDISQKKTVFVFEMQVRFFVLFRDVVSAFHWQVAASVDAYDMIDLYRFVGK